MRITDKRYKWRKLCCSVAALLLVMTMILPEMVLPAAGARISQSDIDKLEKESDKLAPVEGISATAPALIPDTPPTKPAAN